MSVAGVIRDVFDSVACAFAADMDLRLSRIAFDGAKDRSPEEQDKLWKRVHRLIRRGADPNVIAKNPNSGRTAFAQIMWGGYDIVVQRMLEAGADPNLPEGPNDKTVPFLIAATMGSVPMMRALINKGAGVEALTEDGENAVHCLLTHALLRREKAGFESEKKRVQEAYDFLTRDCGLALDPRTTQYIFTDEPNLAFVDPKLERAWDLWDAAVKDDLPRLEQLLVAGVPPDSARDFGQSTALHYAITANRQPAIRLLINANADPAKAGVDFAALDPAVAAFVRQAVADRDADRARVESGQSFTVKGPLRFRAPDVKA